jgi:carboxypeptidase-like protein
MKRHLYLGFLSAAIFLVSTVFTADIANAQYKISGTVVNEKDKPLKGVNVYLDNTLDGGTTDSTGVFRFTTSEKGNQTIVASEVSHGNTGQPIVIDGDVSGIVLRMVTNKSHDLSEVVITAGSFGASDQGKTVLRPLDIVTTAGANADVVKAIETLPGTQQTGPDNGLFVRGGDANEASIIVDGVIVQNAFLSGPPGVATRSRFGAFQFQGISFSSGGYSARYGQALSGVLELTSNDLPDKSTVNVGINMAGVYASGTKKWKKSSLDVGGNYNNTTPFFGLAKTNFTFYKVPVGASGNIRYVWKPNKDGILKVGVNSSYTKSGITIPNPFAGIPDSFITNQAIRDLSKEGNNVNFVTKDQYYFGTATYKQMFKAKYSLFAAASYSLDQTNNMFGDKPLDETDHRAQFRIEGKDYFTTRLNLLVGSDVQNFGIDKKSFGIFDQQFTETLVSGYTELEWTPINRLAIRPGIRYEHSALLNEDKVAPRLSMAYKTGSYTQVSVAGGIFYQDADNSYLEAGLKPGMQEAIHYIANWQYTRNDRTLRLEGYYKDYANLIRELYNPYDPTTYRIIMDTTTVNNSGHGYAQGLELFWRDKKSVKNLDYWVSYSYIDTRRLYANYPTEATPTYIANHNLNLVTKYFVDKWHTNFSATYSYASGRPYYEPGTAFLSSRTPDFNNLAIAVAYLHTFGKWFSVFYLSIDNITNQHNIFGYRYAYDASGNVTKSPILPALYRSIFFGVNMSLTQFTKDEL